MRYTHPWGPERLPSFLVICLQVLAAVHLHPQGRATSPLGRGLRKRGRGRNDEAGIPSALNFPHPHTLFFVRAFLMHRADVTVRVRRPHVVGDIHTCATRLNAAGVLRPARFSKAACATDAGPFSLTGSFMSSQSLASSPPACSLSRRPTPRQVPGLA